MTEVDAEFETVRIETLAEYLGELVLDRPEDMNTIDDTMLAELPAAVDALEGHDEVRAIMLSGAGDRAFSAGAGTVRYTHVNSFATPGLRNRSRSYVRQYDVQSSRVMGHREGVEHSRVGQEVFGRFRESDLPVVAAIDGYCLGGGMELSMCADLRAASESSERGLPEHRLGLLPAWGGTQRPQRLILAECR